MNRLLFVTIVAAVLSLVAAATAGECRHFFAAPVVQHHAQAVVVAPVHHAQAFVAPQILYQAGYGIEQEAIAEKAALRALAKFTAYQQQRSYPAILDNSRRDASGHAVSTPSPVPAANPSGVFDFGSGKFTPSPGYAGPAPLPPPPLPGAEARNIVAEKCGKCHSGAAPKGGLTIDGVTGMPCDAITASLRAIKDDRMPKGGGLTPEEKGLLMEALLALESK